jgi:hypothetical protein
MAQQLQENYSKWELNEHTGERYRTISLSVPNYEHTFGVEVMGFGRRKLFMEGAPEFREALKEYKHLSNVTESQKVFVSKVRYGDVAEPNKELL